MQPTWFSPNHQLAQQRFQQAANDAAATVHSYEVGAGLTIDVGILGPDDAPTVVTSSGVHGVEGFLGSAIQLALLDRLAHSAAPGVRHVLIHAVNPWGFHHVRRFNEANVDLNRNFLLPEDAYQGAPDGYKRLLRFLNPPSPPSFFEPFHLKAAANIVRHGWQPLKQAIAGGQYEYPQGIFYGGHEPCRSTRIIQVHCDQWMGSAADVVHLDFHSGLGPFGTYKLLLGESPNASADAWYVSTFGPEHVELNHHAHATAYVSRGSMGSWLQHHFADRRYRFVTAEYGTYGAVRVLAAIRAENRAHHFAPPESTIYRRAKAELLECFCPHDEGWRQRAVSSALQITAKAEHALLG